MQANRCCLSMQHPHPRERPGEVRALLVPTQASGSCCWLLCAGHGPGPGSGSQGQPGPIWPFKEEVRCVCADPPLSYSAALLTCCTPCLLRRLEQSRTHALNAFCSHRAEREAFLLQQRAGPVETVPQLQQRLLQRRQIIDSLIKWTGSVLKKEGWVDWPGLCRRRSATACCPSVAARRQDGDVHGGQWFAANHCGIEARLWPQVHLTCVARA